MHNLLAEIGHNPHFYFAGLLAVWSGLLTGSMVARAVLAWAVLPRPWVPTPGTFEGPVQRGWFAGKRRLRY